MALGSRAGQAQAAAAGKGTGEVARGSDHRRRRPVDLAVLRRRSASEPQRVAFATSGGGGFADFAARTAAAKSPSASRKARTAQSLRAVR
jgi:hypothetical protein